jgi:hypothetical protein
MNSEVTRIDMDEPRPALSEQDDAISRSLVDTRRNARPLPDFPGRLPETLEQAYAIQAASIVSDFGNNAGVHDVLMTSLARVDFGSFGSFDVKFEPRTRQDSPTGRERAR